MKTKKKSIKNNFNTIPQFKIIPGIDGKIENSSPMWHLFKEEMKYVMPIGGESKNYPNFDSKIVGPQEQEKRALIILNSLYSQNFREDTKSFLCSVINELAYFLCYNGILKYEIVKVDQDNFRLYPFPLNIYKFFIYYFQYVPKRKSGLNKILISQLNKNQVFSIKFPKKLGGVRHFKKIKSVLNKYDSLGPRFFTQNPLTYNLFDFNKYTSKYEVYTGMLTRQYGHKTIADKKITEFYYLYRIIQSKISQTTLREEIVRELNKLFLRLAIDAQIEITGIPSSEDLLKIKESFSRGDIKLDDVLDKIWL